MKYSLPLVALGLLGGCVTAPPPSLTADNPASPSAPEAGVRPLHNALAADDLTRKTRELLTQTGKPQDQPSVASDPGTAPNGSNVRHEDAMEGAIITNKP